MSIEFHFHNFSSFFSNQNQGCPQDFCQGGQKFGTIQIYDSRTPSPLYFVRSPNRWRVTLHMKRSGRKKVQEFCQRYMLGYPMISMGDP